MVDWSFVLCCLSFSLCDKNQRDLCVFWTLDILNCFYLWITRKSLHPYGYWWKYYYFISHYILCQCQYCAKIPWNGWKRENDSHTSDLSVIYEHCILYAIWCQMCAVQLGFWGGVVIEVWGVYAKGRSFFFFLLNMEYNAYIVFWLFDISTEVQADWYTLCSGQFYAFDNNNKETCIHIYSLCHIITLLLKMIFNFGKCKRCIEFVIHLIWKNFLLSFECSWLLMINRYIQRQVIQEIDVWGFL